MFPLNVIIMREQLNVKQRQAISETPAKGGGGLVETCFSSLGRMVAFPGKRPWLGCCLQGSVLIECYLRHVRRISTDRRASVCRFRINFRAEVSDQLLCEGWANFFHKTAGQIHI